MTCIGLPTSLIEQLAECTHSELWPDLTLLLDAPVAVGRARRRRRGPADRIEAESEHFFEQVRRSYLERQRRAADRIKLVDAGQSRAQVQAAIQSHLDPLIAASRDR